MFTPISSDESAYCFKMCIIGKSFAMLNEFIVIIYLHFMHNTHEMLSQAIIPIAITCIW